MATEGATTVGAINAKIGATLTELQQKVAEAKALAKDLTSTPTNVKVGADVSEAITKLSAVEAAQRKVGLASDNLKLAYQRLDDAQARGTVSAGRKMAMDLALTKAEYGLTDALRELAVAQAAENEEQDRTDRSQKQNLQRWQAIALAVAALIPLLGPLAGYAVGVAGAFGVMGAAGVLAVLGIKNAMSQGTAAGNSYSAGLQVLKGDLNELSNTAAVSMLSSYYVAIGQINAAMPSLNSSTKLYAQQLGTAGNFLLGTLVTGLKVAQPLLLTAGVYVERVAAGLLSWTKGGGFQSFVQYAVGQLPKVSAALGQIADFALRLVQAASPIGSVVLPILQGVTWALSQIPIPILTTLISVVGAGFLAFKAWQVIPGIVDGVRGAVTALGAAMDTSLGPIGIAVALLGTLAVAVGATVASTQAARAAQLDFTSAIQQDAGVIGEHTRLQVAQNLVTEGAYKTADKLGISQKELTAAVIDGGKAHSEVTAKIRDASEAADKAVSSYGAMAYGNNGASAAEQKHAKSLHDLLDAIEQNRGGIKSQIQVYNEIQNAIGGLTISTAAQLRAEKDNAAQYGVSLPTYQLAKQAQKQTQNQLEQTTTAMQLQNDAAGLLRNALDILNGKTLGVAQAQTGLAGANNSLVDSLKQNHDAVDGTSKAAVANQQAIQQSIQAAQQYAEAVGKSTGSSEQARQALIDSKTQMEDTLRSQGLLTDGVQAYIDKIFQIPDVKNTTVDVDTDAAAAKIAALQKQLEALNSIAGSAQAKLNASGIATGTLLHQATQNRANGGSIYGYAGGGSPGLSGTVFGPGSSTSDSVLARLSVGEEVTKASSANYPGVRPLLKQLNYDAPGTMAALARPISRPVYENHLHVDGAGWNIDAIFNLFQARMSQQQNARTA